VNIYTLAQGHPYSNDNPEPGEDHPTYSTATVLVFLGLVALVIGIGILYEKLRK
jgi:hypothetical protein